MEGETLEMQSRHRIRSPDPKEKENVLAGSTQGIVEGSFSVIHHYMFPQNYHIAAQGIIDRQQLKITQDISILYIINPSLKKYIEGLIISI